MGALLVMADAGLRQQSEDTSMLATEPTKLTTVGVTLAEVLVAVTKGVRTMKEVSSVLLLMLPMVMTLLAPASLTRM
jgi:hypothetical protein